ncbi:MAG: FGGY-family carbohydrate kinase [Chloroflexota bacterium]
MTAQLLMGVDIGTYSSKGVLTTPEGDILAQSVIEHRMTFPRPGWAEHDPENTWWGEFVALSRGLLEKSGRAGDDVAGVAVSAIGPCLLPVGPDDRALRQGILYGVDTRSTKEIAYLNERYGSQEMYRRGGSILSSQAVGPKILWLKNNEPENYRRAAFFHSASDYIVLRLTGEHVMDAYTASLYNPLFDLGAGAWSDEFADEIVDLGRLPTVKWANEIAGEVTAEAAKETGLPAGTPVTVGTVDAVAEAVSVGAVHPGDLMCMYGTTAFLILASPQVAANEAMWAVAHALPGLYGVAAGMATTGAITRWFRDNFARDLESAEADGDNVYGVLAAQAAEVPAGSVGLMLLPYFSGERTPINDPDARGLICGLTLSHDRRHVYRAILEGTAYAIAHNLEVMREAGGEPQRIVAVGGGAKNPVWLQIVSDVSGIPQEVPSETIGASYGDAFLAGLATGIIPSLDVLDSRWVEAERTIETDAHTHDIYKEYYKIYRRLYDDTARDQHDLAALGRKNHG